MFLLNEQARRLGALLAIAGVSLLLVGCAQPMTYSSSSRVKLYGSTAELAADSAMVALVTVIKQQEYPATDSTSAYTASTAVVGQQFRPQGISEKSTLNEKYPIGSEVIIRQLGSKSMIDEDGKNSTLSDGGTYLVFLTLSGVVGAQANEFYITGVTAGLYGSRDGGPSYRWLGADEDKLPSSLNATDLR